MKKIKIGIIDGYYRNDEEKNIITVNNSKIQNINNFHTKIILDLIKNKLGDSCERNIEFVILPILNLNNFGELRDLYWALEKCLLMDVDIINVSLGTNRVIKNKIIDKLIGELKKKGILIVSSFDNSNNPETYIASSPLVMGVE
ncbi:MAG: S8/S53 family peptidase, partial [Peptoniphilus harei]|nr:S8/S53 family peptidase [Peptoniphilus harei]